MWQRYRSRASPFRRLILGGIETWPYDIVSRATAPTNLLQFFRRATSLFSESTRVFVVISNATGAIDNHRPLTKRFCLSLYQTIYWCNTSAHSLMPKVRKIIRSVDWWWYTILVDWRWNCISIPNGRRQQPEHWIRETEPGRSLTPLHPIRGLFYVTIMSTATLSLKG